MSGINPLIAMGAQVPDVGQAVGNALTNFNNFNTLRENQQTSGLRRQAALSEADTARLKSAAITAGQIVPMLESNDIEGTRSILTSRRDQLKKLGLETKDIDEGLVLLDQDPDLLKQHAMQAIQMASMYEKGGESLFAPTPVVDQDGKQILIQASNSPNGKPRILDYSPVDKADVAGRVEKKKIEAREGTETGQAELTSKKVEAEQGKSKLIDRDRAIQAEVTRAQDVKSLLDRASKNPALKNYYGAVAGRTPALKQNTLDLQADIDRVISLASLAARGELKGQGPVSDFEGRMLANAQTVLANRLISPERAAEEMERISDLMQDIMSRGAKSGGDVITQEDLEFTAKEEGISVEEVKRRLKAQGRM
jgi:hypothetical protein